VTVPAVELEYACRRCEQITRQAAANFYYGIRLLPRSKPVRHERCVRLRPSRR